MISHQEHEAWDVLLACQGQLRLAPSGHVIGIDTFCYGGGWLTALDVAARSYWQANEKGQTRRDGL